jgi:IclR family transcriptional regulator, acetate operon repressor
VELSFKMSNEPYPGTQAVLRAIRLLKTFSDSEPVLSLADLSAAARLKKPTAFRLLTALEAEGMVAREAGSDAYRLGPDLLALGGMALRSNDLRSASHPELERLAKETGETATLEIIVEAGVLILDEVVSGHLIATTHWIGTSWPVYATSTGKVLLAHLSDEARRQMLPFPLKEFTPNTIVQPERLEHELDQIRRQGYAIAAEELEAGFVAVGAPVYNFDGRVQAAISSGGPATRLTPERIDQVIPLVLQSAGRISAQFGYPSQPQPATP